MKKFYISIVSFCIISGCYNIESDGYSVVQKLTPPSGLNQALVDARNARCNMGNYSVACDEVPTGTIEPIVFKGKCSKRGNPPFHEKCLEVEDWKTANNSKIEAWQKLIPWLLMEAEASVTPSGRDYNRTMWYLNLAKQVRTQLRNVNLYDDQQTNGYTRSSNSANTMIDEMGKRWEDEQRSRFRDNASGVDQNIDEASTQSINTINQTEETQEQAPQQNCNPNAPPGSFDAC